MARGLHAEQHFEYHRHLRPGDVLRAETRPGKTWEKEGRRAGQARVQRDDHGLPRSGRRARHHRPQRRGTHRAGPGSRGHRRVGGVTVTLQASALKVGDVHSEVVVDDLTRTQIVQYSGASGDYNPLHSDEIFATQVAGFPGIFAHGMLTMGLTGKMVTNYVGDGRLRSFGGRFRAQVWPGDTLTAKSEVVDIRNDENERRCRRAPDHDHQPGRGRGVRRPGDRHRRLGGAARIFVNEPADGAMGAAGPRVHPGPRHAVQLERRQRPGAAGPRAVRPRRDDGDHRAKAAKPGRIGASTRSRRSSPVRSRRFGRRPTGTPSPGMCATASPRTRSTSGIGSMRTAVATSS